MVSERTDLFLLMLNLSQINDTEQIKRIYLEAMSYSYTSLQFSFVSHKNQNKENEIIPISKGNELFCNLLISGDLDSVDPLDFSYIRNSAGLLAVILQNRKYAQALAQKNIKLEESVRESESFIKNLANIAPVLIYIYDIKSGQNIYANQSLEKIFGYSPENLRKMEKEFFVKTIHPHDLNQVDNHHKILSEAGTGQIIEIKYRVQDINGNWHWLLSRDTPYKKDKQGITTQILGCVLDITTQKENEIQIKKSFDEIKDLKKTLSNIINSMPSILIGVDPNNKITHWNSQAESTYGVKANSAYGKTLTEVIPHFKDQLQNISVAIQEKTVKENQRLLTEIGGKFLYVDTTIYPLIANGADGAVILVDDVTERVRMEEMMIQSEKMLSVGGLAAGMAHEINNPLAGMIQTANVLSTRLTDDLPVNHRAAKESGTTMVAIRAFMKNRGVPRMLRRIHEAGTRAAEIVQNMLSFARKSSDMFSHNLTKLLDYTVDLAGSDYDLKKKYDFRTIEIVREYEEDLPEVYCEAGKIQQVLLNLLRNGAEAMQDMKPCFILRLAYEREVEMVRIEIEDNGPGMDEITRKRVFEPFFTTKSIDCGTGLGLSVSYFIIVENHGGTLSVESILGQGTRFIVRLPVYRS